MQTYKELIKAINESSLPTHITDYVAALKNHKVIKPPTEMLGNSHHIKTVAPNGKTVNHVVNADGSSRTYGELGEN